MSKQTDADVARQVAERRLLEVLRRFHRREPMADGMRSDALLAALHKSGDRPAGHRGARPLSLDDAALLELVDTLVEQGAVERVGRRLRVASHRAELRGQARASADALLSELRAAGASVPRVERVAGRLGVGPWVIDALRQSGELVSVGSGIDYPRDALDALLSRLRLAGVETVGQARDELGTSRRFAAALLEALRAKM